MFKAAYFSLFFYSLTFYSSLFSMEIAVPMVEEKKLSFYMEDDLCVYADPYCYKGVSFRKGLKIEIEPEVLKSYPTIQDPYSVIEGQGSSALLDAFIELGKTLPSTCGKDPYYIKDTLLPSMQKMCAIRRTGIPNCEVKIKDDFSGFSENDLFKVALDVDYLGETSLIEIINHNKLFDSIRFPETENRDTLRGSLRAFAQEQCGFTLLDPSKALEECINNSAYQGKINLCSGGPYLLQARILAQKHQLTIRLPYDSEYEQNREIINKANKNGLRCLKYYGIKYGVGLFWAISSLLLRCAITYTKYKKHPTKYEEEEHKKMIAGWDNIMLRFYDYHKKWASHQIEQA